MKRMALLLALVIGLTPLAAWAGDGHYEDGSQFWVINDILLVNKSYHLPANYAPPIQENQLYGEATKAFAKMKADAAKAGIPLYLCSGYRSYPTQVLLFNNYAARSGAAAANVYSAKAGESEHQTGLCADIGDLRYQGLTLEKSFGETEAGKWLAKNAAQYGFILRYPLGMENRTGYQYEPWHFRYIGKQDALELQKHPYATLEDYLGITGNLDRAVAYPLPLQLRVGTVSSPVMGYKVKGTVYVSLRDLIQFSEGQELDVGQLTGIPAKAGQTALKPGGKGRRIALPTKTLPLQGKGELHPWLIDGSNYISAAELGKLTGAKVDLSEKAVVINAAPKEESVLLANNETQVQKLMDSLVAVI